MQTITRSEYEFISGVRERRIERAKARRARARAEEARRQRLERIGEVLIAPALLALLYAACVAAFI